MSYSKIDEVCALFILKAYECIVTFIHSSDAVSFVLMRESECIQKCQSYKSH